MGDTLHEKLGVIKDKLDFIHTDVAAALTIQGLYREPEDFMLPEIGTLIRLIKTEDFHFRYNFKDMDSVGRIRTLKTGQACGGLVFDIKPYPFDLEDKSLDMKKETKPHYCDGGFGVPKGGLSSIQCTIFDIEIPTMEFKSISVQPEVFHPLIEEEEEQETE